MKRLSRAIKSPTGIAMAVAVLTSFWAGGRASAQLPYRAGDVVGTNFGFQNRLLWTNDLGQVYTPSNTTIRLHDFTGKIVFFCFFDVW